MSYYSFRIVGASIQYENELEYLVFNFLQRFQRDDRFIFERFLYKRRMERLFLKRGDLWLLLMRAISKKFGSPLNWRKR